MLKKHQTKKQQTTKNKSFMNSSILLAFALGGPEIIGIGVIVLLLFGAKKLPELAKGIGRASGEFKKAQNEFKHSLESAEEEAIKKDQDSDSKS